MSILSEAPRSLAERDHVLFDLDGTLIDSRPAIVATYKHVFASLLDAPFPDDDESLQEILAMRPVEVFTRQQPDALQACLASYSDYYVSQGVRLVQPYAGVRELLSVLKARGFCVGIVTNKGQERAKLDLRSTGLLDVDALTVLIGAEHTAERKPHPAPILAALDVTNRQAARTIYVGDGPHDITAARRAGVASVGVAYGYYPEPMLRAAGADAIIARPQDLLELVDAVPTGWEKRSAMA